MRTIITCPGIGDICFLFQKLINQPEKFHWEIWDGVKNGAQAQPQRGHQVFDLLPQLTESFTYIPNAGYNKIKRNSYSGSWITAPRGKFILEANAHLESGKRIEDFLPDLETSFILPFQTSEEDYLKACEIIDFNYSKFIAGESKLIGIYTTSYNNSQYMSGWLIDEWCDFITLLQNYNPEFKFVFLGAAYDRGISDEVMKRMEPVSYIDLIDKTTLPVLIEILKRLHCFVGFQSGLLILNEMIGARQTVMLYSPALQDMMGTWPDPKRIDDGSYKGCTFGAGKHLLKPEKLFDWLKQNNKL